MCGQQWPLQYKLLEREHVSDSPLTDRYLILTPETTETFDRNEQDLKHSTSSDMLLYAVDSSKGGQDVNWSEDFDFAAQSMSFSAWDFE